MSGLSFANKFHKDRHKTGGPDALSPADIGAITSSGVDTKINNNNTTERQNQANTYGPAIGSDNWLKAWASSVDTLIRSTTITRDADGAATSASVIWPDGTTGAYTGIASTAFPGAIDSYTVTYVGATTKTVTQPSLTRDSVTGAVTNRPGMTVT